MTPTHWDTLLDGPHAAVKRSGRFLVVDLDGPHRVLSTSVKNGGEVDDLRHLVNHQSLEGAGHNDRHARLQSLGLDAYHDVVCDEIGRPAAFTAVMGTAANMRYAAVVTVEDLSLRVTAIVTAGVEGNATCAGDPAGWRETDQGWKSVTYAGTINTIVLINSPLTRAALARAVVTLTEGKSAALQRLAVPSRQSKDLATGTGTDQFCVAAPMAGPAPLTSASTHVKLGELIGVSVRDATQESLRWQNGLEMSYTRSMFHALGRYGLREATIFDEIAPYLNAADLELLRRNSKAVFYEPMAGAAAYGLAAVLDRVRQGCLPSGVEAEAALEQAATLATSIATRVECWPALRRQLSVHAGQDPRTLVLAAIALGWSEKWRSD